MNKLFCAFALSSLSLATVGASSDAAATNDLLEVESSSLLPTVEAGVYYRSMKIERGKIENPESVFGYEVALEWYGFFGGVETCYDMTDVNGRRGRYNEIESFLGYGYTLGDLTAKAAYVYKACAGDENDTQAVELEIEYETPWVTPFFALECDTHDKPGALYGVVGLVREWELTDWLTAVVNGGIGFGNPYRNDASFECERWAFREICLGAALEIELCPHVKLVPAIDFYDYFTDAQRRIYDKFHGFAAVAGCRLAVDF